jgi:SAM-dependent methyltransferase
MSVNPRDYSYAIGSLWANKMYVRRTLTIVSMLTSDEKRFFDKEQELHEGTYLFGTNPRQQSGFGRDERDWERFRRGIVAPVERDGSFLDIGCANGLLMESVVQWAGKDGHSLEPYGLDISEKLAELARQRLPRWRDRIFVGNALFWDPPKCFDFVRTEMVYVPNTRRREYMERLLARVVAPGGRLIVCSYGSSRPEGARAEPLLDDLRCWGLDIFGVYDVMSPEHGFVITRVVSVICPMRTGY